MESSNKHTVSDEPHRVKNAGGIEIDNQSGSRMIALENDTSNKLDQNNEHVAMDTENLDQSVFVKPHPLLIPHILEKVLNNLNIDDILNCRQVCSLWKIEAKTMIRNQFVVNLNSTNRLVEYIEAMANVPVEDFPHSLYNIGIPCRPLCPPTAAARAVARIQSINPERPQNRIPPIQNIYGRGRMDIDRPEPADVQAFVNDHEMGDEDGGGEAMEMCRNSIERFFTNFGPRIKKLELRTDYYLPMENLEKYLKSCTPNLEALSVTILHNRSRRLFTTNQVFTKPALTTLSLRSCTEMIPISLLRDFFLMVPNLRKLTCLPIFTMKKYATNRLNEPLPGRVDFLRVLFHTVAMAPYSPPLAVLTNLDINLQLTETEIQGLVSKDFPLREISLGICADVKGSTLANLLTLGSNNFKKISLNFHPNSGAARHTYNVSLPRLEYLSLCGFRGPIHFLRGSQVLKTLIMAKIWDLKETFPLHGLELTSLKSLYLQWDDLLDPKTIIRITSCFPKLTSFSMKKGSDETLMEIYLTMPYLEKLTILNGGFTDEGITGIAEVVYNDIAESGSLPIVDAGKLRTKMSIATLSNLRKLRLESDQMTDVSVYLGIGCCLHLEHLHLQCPKISDYSVMRIGRFPHLKSLNLVSCTGLSTEWKFQLRDYFRDNGKQVKLVLETIEEVLLESQKRALLLPLYAFSENLLHAPGVFGFPIEIANRNPAPQRQDLDPDFFELAHDWLRMDYESDSDDDDNDVVHGAPRQIEVARPQGDNRGPPPVRRRAHGRMNLLELVMERRGRLAAERVRRGGHIANANVRLPFIRMQRWVPQRPQAHEHRLQNEHRPGIAVNGAEPLRNPVVAQVHQPPPVVRILNREAEQFMEQGLRGEDLDNIEDGEQNQRNNGIPNLEEEMRQLQGLIRQNAQALPPPVPLDMHFLEDIEM